MIMNANYESIFSKDKLIAISKEMQKAHFKPGYDKMTAQKAGLWIEINYDNLLEQLKKDKYKPLPLMGATAIKNNGIFIQDAMPCAIDAILQNAIADYLSENFKDLFSEHDHAYIKGQGSESAVKEYCNFSKNYKLVLKIDPPNYFNSIDQTVLRETLTGIGISNKLTTLILRFIKAPKIEDGKSTRLKTGIPLGLPISAFLANIYLLRLDRYLENNHHAFVRYGSDIAVFGNDVFELKRI